jgi:hypothetical protein
VLLLKNSTRLRRQGRNGDYTTKSEPIRRRFWANQFRVSLTVAAYILMQEFRKRTGGKLRRQKRSLPVSANATCPVVKLMN